MKPNKIQSIVKISIMAAVAAIVMLFKFALPLTPPFYTIDFSEVVVLLAGFTLGPLSAIAVEGLKILLNLLLNGTTTMGVGEVANFLMGCSFVVSASVIYHKNKTRKQAIIAMAIGVIALVIVASLLNYFVLLPAYAYFFHMPLDALIAQSPLDASNIFTFILVAVVPFNIIKGALTSIVVFLIYKKVTPILKK